MKETSKHTVHITETINAPVEKVWKIIRGFNDLPSYHPAIKASELIHGDGETVGSIRHLTLEDGYVREILLMLDDKNHAFDYSITEGTFPVKNYKASVRLTFDQSIKKTICEWWADFEAAIPNELNALIEVVGQQIFKVGFQSVANLVE